MRIRRNLVMLAAATAMFAVSFAGSAAAAPATNTETGVASTSTPSINNAGIRIKYYYRYANGITESQASFRAVTKGRIKARKENRNGWDCGVGTITRNSDNGDGTWTAEATISCVKVT